MGLHINEFISALVDLMSAKVAAERRRGEYDDYSGCGEWKAEERARAAFPEAVREALEEIEGGGRTRAVEAPSSVTDEYPEGSVSAQLEVPGPETEPDPLLDLETFSAALAGPGSARGKKRPSR